MNGGSPQRRSWVLRDALSLRIAIIGLGPKGLYALERLIDHLARARLAAEIDVFEPHPAPGAGPAYDPDEPSYLRMNFSAEHVDMWWREDASERHFVPAAEQLSFVEWSHARGVPCATDEYPARGVVGDYLADGGMRILRHAPDRLRIRVRRVRVDDLRRTASGWEVRSGGAGMGRFDEVLVTIGHQPGGEDALAASWHHFAPLVRTPFPVTAQLASRTVRPGAVVAVRGFALSFIDAALALTEGRGGSFVQTAHPFRLTYLHSAHEVVAIVPFSRTGHPMLPKPEPILAASIPGLEQIAITWRDRLRNLPSPPNLEVDLLPVIASCGVGIWAACKRSRRRQARRASRSRRWALAGCSRERGAASSLTRRTPHRAGTRDRGRTPPPGSPLDDRGKLACVVPGPRGTCRVRWTRVRCVAEIRADCDGDGAPRLRAATGQRGKVPRSGRRRPH